MFSPKLIEQPCLSQLVNYYKLLTVEEALVAAKTIEAFSKAGRRGQLDRGSTDET